MAPSTAARAAAAAKATPTAASAAAAAAINLDGAPEDHKLDLDRRRAREHRKKYARGVQTAEKANGQTKPAKPRSAGATNRERVWNSKFHARAAANAKSLGKYPSIPPRAVVGNDDNSSSGGGGGSSSNYNTGHAAGGDSASSSRDGTASPEEGEVNEQEEEEDFAYSFDAARGPFRGSEILGLAINKAVERFETRETERLIRAEYEVVSVGGGADADDADTANELGLATASSFGRVDEDLDFEFV